MSYSEDIIRAMELLAEEYTANLKFDKTIQAQIEETVNVEIGEYRVRYEGNIYKAYSEDPTKIYEIDDKVYVKIPEGDYSNKKIIEGLITKNNAYGELLDNQTEVGEIGPTWDHFFNYNPKEEWGLVAGVDNSSQYFMQVIYDKNNDPDYQKGCDLFLNYSKNFDIIRLRGSFNTHFLAEHTKGNYGLLLTFDCRTADANETSLVQYKLDFNSFTGNPYAYNVYSPQEVLIQVQKDYLLGLNSIIFFQEAFETDKNINHVTNEIIYENLDDPNILVKDLDFQFVELIDLSENLYYLNIKTPRGTALVSPSQTDDIKLVGELRYAKKNILRESNCVCKWYKEDLSVMVGTENYDSDVGVCWKQIEPKEDDGFNELTITYDEVVYQQRYMLYVFYNETVVMTKIITVYRYNSQYAFELSQETTSNNIILKITDLKNGEEYKGKWYQTLPDGSYTSVAEEKKNSIEIVHLLVYPVIKFHCAVFDSADNFITNLETTITNTEDESDLTVAYSGEDMYQYDANGDVEYEDSEKERTLYCTFTWADGVGTSFKMEWIAPDGTVLGRNKYSPKDSMMQDMWIDENNVLHYTIRQKYYFNYNTNTYNIRIITIDNKVYTFEKEILFLKDGDQGTNGTTYVCAIRPTDSNGMKLSGLHGLRMTRDGVWDSTEPLNLRCFVYKNGDLINEFTKDPNYLYDLEFVWESVEQLTLFADSANKPDYISVRGNSIETTGGYMIKVQVNITDKKDNVNTSIYCTYPVTIFCNFTDAQMTMLDHNIPQYIKYTSTGNNPKYFNENLYVKYGATDYIENLKTLNSELLNITKSTDIETEVSTYRLKPVSNFDYENGIAALKCTFSNSSQYIIFPIMMYLDTFGNEAINGWDGTKLKTTDGYILAPQIGAGEKEKNTNLFTGVIMGKDTSQANIGLYGYQRGISTFGLMQNGEAYFGAEGHGRIWLDGRRGEISGGTGGENRVGMTIRLSPGDEVNNNVKAIQIAGRSNQEFYVQYDGTMHAEKAYIDGTIYSDNGRIGGWEIGEDTISAGGTTLSSDGSIECTYLDARGSGYIGGWTINHSSLSSGGTTLSSTGKITCANLEANQNGSIGGWEIGSSTLKSQNNLTSLDSSGVITTRYINIQDDIYSSKVGAIGYVKGGFNDSGTTVETNNLGIATSSGYGIKINSAEDLSIDADGIYLYADSTFQLRGTISFYGSVDMSKATQTGIYARFA